MAPSWTGDRCCRRARSHRRPRYLHAGRSSGMAHEKRSLDDERRPGWFILQLHNERLALLSAGRVRRVSRRRDHERRTRRTSLAVARHAGLYGVRKPSLHCRGGRGKRKDPIEIRKPQLSADRGRDSSSWPGTRDSRRTGIGRFGVYQRPSVCLRAGRMGASSRLDVNVGFALRPLFRLRRSGQPARRSGLERPA